MMYWWHGGGGWGYALMSLGMVVFWGGVVVLAVVLLRSLIGNGRAGSTAHRTTPEEILAERFARGEITEQEYHERLAVLQDRRRSHAE